MSERYEHLRAPLDPDLHDAMRTTVRAELARLRGQQRTDSTTNVPEGLTMSIVPRMSPRRPLLLAAASVILVATGVAGILALSDGSGDEVPAELDSAAPTTTPAEPGTTAAATVTPTATPAAVETLPATSPPPTTSSAEMSVESAASAVFDLSYDPAHLAASDGSLWITRWLDGGLERRGAADGSVGGTIEDVQNSGSMPIVRPVVAFGSVWATTGDAVRRIDPDEDTVTATVTIPGGSTNATGRLSHLAVGSDGIWTLSHGDTAAAVKIDPTSAEIVERIPVAGSPASLGFGSGSLWLVNGFLDGLAITRVDPSDGSVVAVIDLPFVPHSLLTGDGAVWVFGQAIGDRDAFRPAGDWLVARIDTDANSVVSTATAYVGRGTEIALAEADLAVGGGSVWVTTPDGLVRIDAETMQLTATYSGTGDGGVAVTDESVWLTDKLDRKLYRIPFDR